MTTNAPPRGRVDLLTVVAIALVAYAITNTAHEGLGHGGACAVAGGKPVSLNAIYFECDKTGLSPAAVRWIAAGGTLVNLTIGALVAAALRLARQTSPRTRYFLWLLMTLSFLQATGYWLFSGLAKIGDWAAVVDGWAPAWMWRVLLTAAGAAGYLLTVRLALRILSPLLGDGDGRLSAARKVTVLPYLAGGTMYVVAGLLNPASKELVLISAAAASFGGTSALAWMASPLNDRKRYPDPGVPPLSLERSIPWLIAGGVAALLFIVVLGRTVQL